MPIIKDLHQLRRLAFAPPHLLPGRRTVRLELGGLDEVVRERWEARLTRLSGACGCKSGAASIALFLVVAVGSLVTGVLEVSLLSLGLVMVGGLAAAALGKLAGILVARLWLLFAVRSLTRAIEGIPHDEPSQPRSASLHASRRQ